MTIAIRSAVVIVLTAVLAGGCGKSAPQIIEVNGTVKLDGKPLEKIHVEFIPELEGPQSFGVTDAEGRFSLQTQDGTKKGAAAGKYRVVLQDASIISEAKIGRESEEVDLTQGKKPRISEEYVNQMKTPLTAEVTADKRSFDFDVKPYAGP